MPNLILKDYQMPNLPKRLSDAQGLKPYFMKSTVTSFHSDSDNSNPNLYSSAHKRSSTNLAEDLKAVVHLALALGSKRTSCLYCVEMIRIGKDRAIDNAPGLLGLWCSTNCIVEVLISPCSSIMSGLAMSKSQVVPSDSETNKECHL